MFYLPREGVFYFEGIHGNLLTPCNNIVVADFNSDLFQTVSSGNMAAICTSNRLCCGRDRVRTHINIQWELTSLINKTLAMVTR